MPDVPHGVEPLLRARRVRGGARAGQGPARPRHGAGARPPPRPRAAGSCCLRRRQPRRFHRQGHVAAPRRQARAHAEGRRRHMALKSESYIHRRQQLYI